MQNFFVTGIGTGIGKTLSAAVLCEASGADYWKPVQAGSLEHSDDEEVRGLVSIPGFRVHPSAFRLHTAASPHYAAAADGLEISLADLVPPLTIKPLVIEGAGGIMVPLNSRETFLDWLAAYPIPVVVVSSYYLGSINHTLLTVQVMRDRNIPLAGLILNGEPMPGSKEIILSLTGLPLVLEIPALATVNKQAVSALAQQVKI